MSYSSYDLKKLKKNAGQCNRYVEICETDDCGNMVTGIGIGEMRGSICCSIWILTFSFKWVIWSENVPLFFKLNNCDELAVWSTLLGQYLSTMLLHIWVYALVRALCFALVYSTAHSKVQFSSGSQPTFLLPLSLSVPVCVRMCLIRFFVFKNLRLQYIHLPLFLCLCKCTFKSCWTTKLCLQYRHEKGRTSLCVRICVFKFILNLHVNGQCSQAYRGLGSEGCVRICNLNVFLIVVLNEQYSQECTKCARIWWIKLLFTLLLNGQCLQEYGCLVFCSCVGCLEYGCLVFSCCDRPADEELGVPSAPSATAPFSPSVCSCRVV